MFDVIVSAMLFVMRAFILIGVGVGDVNADDDDGEPGGITCSNGETSTDSMFQMSIIGGSHRHWKYRA